MRYILLMLLAPAFFGMVNAHAGPGLVVGRITDKDNHPVVDFNVGLVGTISGAVTDAEGDFSIRNLPAGLYQMLVSGVSSQSQKQNISVSADGIRSLNIGVRESLPQLPEVEPVGRKKTSYQNDVSFIAPKTTTPPQDIPPAVNYMTKQDQQAGRNVDIVKNTSESRRFLTIKNFY